MSLKLLFINEEKFCPAPKPEDNLCYFVPDVGTFWLQGTKSSGEPSSRATFIWYHNLTELDCHSENLEYIDIVQDDEYKFWHYRFYAPDEDGRKTVVNLLLSDFEVPSQGYRVFYQREGKDEGYVLWSWNAKRFTGHEDHTHE